MNQKNRYPTIYQFAVDDSTAAIKMVVNHFSRDKWQSFAGPIVLSALLAYTFREMKRQQPEWFNQLGPEGERDLKRDIRRKLTKEIGQFL